MKKTKIVATVGPASSSPDMLRALIEAGVNVFRLNFSHGNHESHREELAAIREAARATKTSIATMLDTKGPEIRTGDFKEESVELTPGSSFSLYREERLGDGEGVYQTYDNLYHDVKPGQKILIDDGLIAVSYTHLTLPTTARRCRSRWSPYH